MILMWFGPLILAFAGLEIFRRAVGDGGGYFQKCFLEMRTPPSSVFSLLLVTKFAGIATGSLLQTQYSAVALLNARTMSRRYSLLLLCLSAAGAWTTLLGLLCAWQVSGFYLLSLAALVWLFWFWSGRGLKLRNALFGFGVFLLGIEWTLRQHSVIFSLLGESDLHFLMVDGRWSAICVWALVGFAVTCAIGFESWSVFIGLVLLAGGSFSVNGVIALIAGELLADVWMLWWRSRNLNSDVRSLSLKYAFVSTLGIFVGLGIAGYLRGLFAQGYTFDATPLVEKALTVALMYFVMIATMTLAAMMWGHFAAQTELKEVQTGRYFPSTWSRRGWVSKAFLEFIYRGLSQRLADLKTQTSSLAGAHAQVPASLLKIHAEEMSQLTLWLEESDKSREKF